MRVRRPHEHGAGKPLEPEIAHECPVPEQELGVLEALNAVAQQRAWHLAKPTAPPTAGVRSLAVVSAAPHGQQLLTRAGGASLRRPEAFDSDAAGWHAGRNEQVGGVISETR